MKFICSSCGLEFDTRDGYDRHQYQSHGGKTWPTSTWLSRRLTVVRRRGLEQEQEPLLCLYTGDS